MNSAILIITAGRTKQLSSAIQSALNQTVPVRVLVLNDCEAQIIYHDDPRVTIYNRPRLANVGEKRTELVRIAQSEGIEEATWLDDDDTIAADFFEQFSASWHTLGDRAAVLRAWAKRLPSGEVSAHGNVVFFCPSEALKLGGWGTLDSGQDMHFLGLAKVAGKLHKVAKDFGYFYSHTAAPFRLSYGNTNNVRERFERDIIERMMVDIEPRGEVKLSVNNNEPSIKPKYSRFVELVFTCSKHRSLAVATHRPHDGDTLWMVESRESRDFRFNPEGVRVIETQVRRPGNLNGTDWMWEYLKLLEDFEAAGVEVIFKRDSDTIIVDRANLIPSEGKAVRAVSHTRRPELWWGCCYGLRLSVAIPMIRAALEKQKDPRIKEDAWLAPVLESKAEMFPNFCGRMANDLPREYIVWHNLDNFRQYPIGKDGKLLTIANLLP